MSTPSGQIMFDLLLIRKSLFLDSLIATCQLICPGGTGSLYTGLHMYMDKWQNGAQNQHSGL